MPNQRHITSDINVSPDYIIHLKWPMIYGFWLPPWYLLAIVLSVLLWYTDSDYPFVSFGHCFVCSSMIYAFWLPLCIFWPLFCLLFYDKRILITPLVSSNSSKWEYVYHRRKDNTMDKRYQEGNQNPYIIEEQTKQWSKDTKGVIRVRIS
jgi:hypothetical protein